MDKEEIKENIRETLENENLDIQSSYFIIKELMEDLWLEIQEEDIGESEESEEPEESEDDIGESEEPEEEVEEEPDELDEADFDSLEEPEEPEVVDLSKKKPKKDLKKSPLIKRPVIKVKK